MARREIIVYVDDVTGKETNNVTAEIICVEGVAYQVDMGPETLAAYRKAVEPYRAAGTRIGRATSGGSVLRPIGSASSAGGSVPRRTVADKEQNKAIREWWAKNQGREGLPPVVERGRIPGDVITAFHAHGGRAIEAAPKRAEIADAEGTIRGRGGLANMKNPAAKSTAPAATFTSAEAPKPAGKKTTAAKSAVPPQKRTTAARVGNGGKGHDTAAKRTGRRVAAN